MNITNNKPQPDKIYFLTEIMRAKVIANNKFIGKLDDVVIMYRGSLIPHVTHFVIARPYGDPVIIVPIEKIESITSKVIILDISSVDDYGNKMEKEALLLKDYVLNKKVVDFDEREISVVYDVKIIQINKKLYVSDVDFSPYGLFKRLGLKRLADWMKIKEDLLSWTYVLPLPDNIDSFKGNVQLKTVKDNLADLPPADLADILEELSREQRSVVFNELDAEHASDTLEEIDPNVQREIVSSMEKAAVAKLINDMTPAQAADVLAVIPYTDKETVLKLIDPDMSSKIQSLLNQEEENILNLATSSYLAFKPEDVVETVRKVYQQKAGEMDVLMYLYVTDETGVLTGILDIRELLIANDQAKLSDIIIENIISLSPESTLKDASAMFNRYGFRALPVVDPVGKILGVVPYRDVMNLKHRSLS